MSIATANPPQHWIIYGDSGARKTTALATWPKPLLVFMFDPYGKDTPFLQTWNPDGTRKPRGVDLGFSYDVRSTPVRKIVSAKNPDNLLIQIEYYHDVDPENPECYERFKQRMHRFQDEYDQWATVAVDSATFMELSARKQSQYRTKKGAKEPRQWYADSTEWMEEMLMIRFGSLPMNVVVLCHIDEDKDEVLGTFVRNPKAPGRLRKGISSGYGEFYRQYMLIEKDPQNRVISRESVFQTLSDGQYNAMSQIGAPNDCPATYAALWSGQ